MGPGAGVDPGSHSQRERLQHDANFPGLSVVIYTMEPWSPRGRTVGMGVWLCLTWCWAGAWEGGCCAGVQMVTMWEEGAGEVASALWSRPAPQVEPAWQPQAVCTALRFSVKLLLPAGPARSDNPSKLWPFHRGLPPCLGSWILSGPPSLSDLPLLTATPSLPVPCPHFLLCPSPHRGWSKAKDGSRCGAELCGVEVSLLPGDQDDLPLCWPLTPHWCLCKRQPAAGALPAEL